MDDLGKNTQNYFIVVVVQYVCMNAIFNLFAFQYQAVTLIFEKHI